MLIERSFLMFLLVLVVPILAIVTAGPVVVHAHVMFVAGVHLDATQVRFAR